MNFIKSLLFYCKGLKYYCNVYKRGIADLGEKIADYI